VFQWGTRASAFGVCLTFYEVASVMHTKITKRVLESTVNESSNDVFLRDSILKGFGVRITPTGGICFFAEGRIRKGRNKRIALGRYPVLDINEAREKAREALYQLRSGVDPHALERDKLALEAKQEALEAACSVTLQKVIDDYFQSRPIKSEACYRKVLKSVFGDWFTTPIRDISRQDIEDRYRIVAFKDDHKPQAAKAMRYLSAVMNFAKAELIEGQPLIASNPVEVLRDKKVDRTVKPRRTHIRKEQLPRFVEAVTKLCTQTARDLLFLELATGLRDQEAKTLKWEHIDFSKGQLTVLSTKNGRDLTLPMADFVFELLERRYKNKKHECYVFENRRGNGSLGSIRKQIAKITKETGITFTHHDLRRTFATLLSNELKVSDGVISRLLNHSPKGVTEKHYIISSPQDHIEIYNKLCELVFMTSRNASASILRK
jgi:integrase